jgi:hypothetical protein
MSTQWRAKAPVRQKLVKKYSPIGPAAIAAAVNAMKGADQKYRVLDAWSSLIGA